MSLGGLTDPGLGRGGNPRNIWTRLLQALDIAAAPGRPERWHLAEKILHSVRHSPDMSEEVFETYRAQIEALRPKGLAPAPVNRPADFLGHAQPMPHRAFRRLLVEANPPKPFPWGMALPQLVGPQNDSRFLYDAATALALTGAEAAPPPRIHVFADAPRLGGPGGIGQLMQDLARQSHDGPVRLTLFGDPGGALPAPPPGGPDCDHVPAGILSEEARGQMAWRLEETDLVIFVSAALRLDPGALARAAWPMRTTQMLVQPLVGLADVGEDDLRTPYDLITLHKSLPGRFPFRALQGMNMIVPAPLVQRAGLPDPRFATRFSAAREFGFRLHNRGAWFTPLALPRLDHACDDNTPEDQKLYTSLTPNLWDRKQAHAGFEVPKVSVYIPAYNASKYIERAIDSVLEQDFQDLEVCISNDGSYDDTLGVLERRYGDERRVKWLANPNGGIGFASNAAIEMARGAYIGQLDSDDCLKPGAVRRLVEVLDKDPQLACAYGSCERVDAQGHYLQDEYSWPVFSREKMMVTSIAHHFRMFRRAAWERTSKFREDIVNAVDYDIFLKLSETGHFHHVEEVLYQRRWHGENTSNVNEHHQTTNTYRVQTEALERLGLDRFWEVKVVEGQDDPRRVTYRRKPGRPMTVFWPDYSRSNPYQKLLYSQARDTGEVVAGTIDAALQLMEQLPQMGGTEGPLTFHLHWLNFLFVPLKEEHEARAAMEEFTAKLTRFKAMGGRIVWTLHNTVSHDSPFVAVETELSERIVALADALHLHSEASIPEVELAFDLDHSKIVISRHGAYVGTYPDFTDRQLARESLGYGADEDIVLFTGQIRPYKGVEQLVAAMRRLFAERPRARLVLAGAMQVDLFEALEPALTPAEQSRIDVIGRFLDDMEMQIFFRAADLAVYPYHKVLTSGSLLLALSFGVPVVVPDVGMTAEVLASGPGPAGVLYRGEADALATAIRGLLDEKDAGRLAAMGQNARAIAEATTWPDFGKVLHPSFEGALSC